MGTSSLSSPGMAACTSRAGGTPWHKIPARQGHQERSLPLWSPGRTMCRCPEHLQTCPGHPQRPVGTPAGMKSSSTCYEQPQTSPVCLNYPHSPWASHSALAIHLQPPHRPQVWPPIPAGSDSPALAADTRQDPGGDTWTAPIPPRLRFSFVSHKTHTAAAACQVSTQRCCIYEPWVCYRQKILQTKRKMSLGTCQVG